MSRSETRPSGVTLVELVLVIVVMGVLAAASAEVVRKFLMMIFYLPNQAKVSQASGELLEGLVELGPTTIAGAPSGWLRGLRFARRRVEDGTSIVLANANEVRYLTFGACEPAAGKCLVRLRLVGTTIRRSYRTAVGATCDGDTFSAEEAMPYYAVEAGINVQGSAGVPRGLPAGSLFRYFDAADVELAVPMSCNPADPNLATIGRIEVGARVYTGSGNFTLAEGELSVTSSVAIRFP